MSLKTLIIISSMLALLILGAAIEYATSEQLAWGCVITVAAGMFLIIRDADKVNKEKNKLKRGDY